MERAQTIQKFLSIPTFQYQNQLWNLNSSLSLLRLESYRRASSFAVWVVFAVSPWCGSKAEAMIRLLGKIGPLRVIGQRYQKTILKRHWTKGFFVYKVHDDRWRALSCRVTKWVGCLLLQALIWHAQLYHTCETWKHGPFLNWYANISQLEIHVFLFGILRQCDGSQEMNESIRQAATLHRWNVTKYLNRAEYPDYKEMRIRVRPKLRTKRVEYEFSPIFNWARPVVPG